MTQASLSNIARAIDLDVLRRAAGAAVWDRGLQFFGRMINKPQIKSIQPAGIDLILDDNGRINVSVLLVRKTVVIKCSCSAGRDSISAFCRHKVAAALWLAKGVSQRPPQETAEAEPDWRTKIGGLLSSKPKRRRQQLEKGIVFFQMGRLKDHLIPIPYWSPLNTLPEDIRDDVDATYRHLSRVEENSPFITEAVKLVGLDFDKYPAINATPATRLLIYLTVERLLDIQTGFAGTQIDLVEGLVGHLVFCGRQSDVGFGFDRVEVIPGEIEVEMEMENSEEGLRVAPAIQIRERRWRIPNKEILLIGAKPLRILVDRQICRLNIDVDSYRRLMAGGETLVPRNEMAEFYRTNLGRIEEEWRPSGSGAMIEKLERVEPRPRLVLSDEHDELQVSLRFDYHGYEILYMRNPPECDYYWDDERKVSIGVARSRESEAAWAERLDNAESGLKWGRRKQGTEPDVFLLRKGVHAWDFLKNRVPRLAAAGFEIYGESNLRSRVSQAKPSISFRVASEIDWFDLKMAVSWGDQEVPLNDMRRAMKRGDRFILLADGTIGEIPEDWLQRYRHLFGLTEQVEDGFRVSRQHLSMLDSILGDDQSVRFDRKFAEARDRLRGFEGITSQKLPAGFIGELRPYQKAGYDWLHFLREMQFGGCLADDMGTGKTIQTLCYLQSIRESRLARQRPTRGRPRKGAPAEPSSASLLVVPRSLVTNWQREAAKFTPELRLLDFAHTDRPAEIGEFDNYDVVLTTYGIMLREAERLTDYEFDTIILDEAQAIKNPLSESATAARLLRSRHRLTLTGTPVENNTLELWSQFSFLNPGLLGSAEYFRENFLAPIERQRDQETAKSLQRTIYPFILRRTKEQVAPDLPPRTEKIIWCEMNPTQQKVYRETRDHYRDLLLKLISEKGVVNARFRVLEGLLRLRQICNHPQLVHPTSKAGSAKMEAILELIANAAAEGHKTLVFSQFVQMLRLIEKEIVRAGMPYVSLDGSTTNRQARVDLFQNEEKIKIFLISLKAGGVGLNLTAADYVIHVDPWWNPAVEMQATDRAHRIGQDRPVFIYKTLTRDSVEEKILQLQERKRDLVKQLISTETGFFKSLTAEDIQGLFS